MALVAVLLALVAVLCTVAARRALRRRRADEIRSIHHYHERLDTLHVEQHDRGGSVRLVEGAAPPLEGASPARPRLDPDSARLDLAEPHEQRPSGSAAGRHGREWALDRSQPKARVDTATTLVVLAVVAGLLVLGIAGYLIQHDRGTSPTTTVTSTTQPATTTTTTTTTAPPS